MNVAALLQDTPSDNDIARRRGGQQSQPTQSSATPIQPGQGPANVNPYPPSSSPVIGGGRGPMSGSPSMPTHIPTSASSQPPPRSSHLSSSSSSSSHPSSPAMASLRPNHNTSTSHFESTTGIGSALAPSSKSSPRTLSAMSPVIPVAGPGVAGGVLPLSNLSSMSAHQSSSMGLTGPGSGGGGAALHADRDRSRAGPTPMPVGVSDRENFSQTGASSNAVGGSARDWERRKDSDLLQLSNSPRSHRREPPNSSNSNSPVTSRLPGPGIGLMDSPADRDLRDPRDLPPPVYPNPPSSHPHARSRSISSRSIERDRAGPVGPGTGLTSPPPSSSTPSRHSLPPPQSGGSAPGSRNKTPHLDARDRAPILGVTGPGPALASNPALSLAEREREYERVERERERERMHPQDGGDRPGYWSDAELRERMARDREMRAREDRDRDRWEHEKMMERERQRERDKDRERDKHSHPGSHSHPPSLSSSPKVERLPGDRGRERIPGERRRSAGERERDRERIWNSSSSANPASGGPPGPGERSYPPPPPHPSQHHYGGMPPPGSGPGAPGPSPPLSTFPPSSSSQNNPPSQRERERERERDREARDQQGNLSSSSVPPQKQFQNQFHTSFVPGLPSGPGGSSSSGPMLNLSSIAQQSERSSRVGSRVNSPVDRARERERRERDRERERERDRERERERDWERERMRAGPGGALPPQAGVKVKDYADGDREMHAHQGGGHIHHHAVHHHGHGRVDERDRDRERVRESRIEDLEREFREHPGIQQLIDKRAEMVRGRKHDMEMSLNPQLVEQLRKERDREKHDEFRELSARRDAAWGAPLGHGYQGHPERDPYVGYPPPPLPGQMQQQQQQQGPGGPTHHGHGQPPPPPPHGHSHGHPHAHGHPHPHPHGGPVPPPPHGRPGEHPSQWQNPHHGGPPGGPPVIGEPSYMVDYGPVPPGYGGPPPPVPAPNGPPGSVTGAFEKFPGSRPGSRSGRHRSQRDREIEQWERERREMEMAEVHQQHVQQQHRLQQRNAIEWDEEPRPKARTAINLGTYVWPRVPFPYFFESKEEKEETNKEGGEEEEECHPIKTTEQEEKSFNVDTETRITIVIPNGHIPLEKPRRPRIWGGGVYAVPTHLRPPLPASPTTPKPQYRPPYRRIYTDDSDVFLCALHSGWVTWSGAAKARKNGKEMKVGVRVIRCFGGTRDGGLGCADVRPGVAKDKTADVTPPPTPTATATVNGSSDKEKDKKQLVGKEEVVARFLGGWGERCFIPGGGLGEEEEVVRPPPTVVPNGNGVEVVVDEDEEDDGRGLVSAGWGVGHDGSAIEIVDVQFVDRGAICSLGGIRNRKQRLAEYNERRLTILGSSSPSSTISSSTPPPFSSAHLASRKRRRGYDWPSTYISPGGHFSSASDTNEDKSLLLGLPVHQEEEKENAEMNSRTVVFGMSVGGDVCVGYKYDPPALHSILFSSSESEEPVQKKRKILEPTDITNIADPETSAMDIDLDTADLSNAKPSTKLRSLILETAKEKYLLSPARDDRKDDGEVKYDLALILDNEEPEEDSEQQPTASTAIIGEKKSEDNGNAAKTSEPETTEDKDKTTENRAEAEPPAAPGEVPKPAGIAPTSRGISVFTPGADDNVIGSAPADSKVTKPCEPATLDSQAPDHVSVPHPPVQPVTQPAHTTSQPTMSLQTLQRNLPSSMFRFEKDGVYVTDGVDGNLIPPKVEDGGEVRTEWVMGVKRWRWALGEGVERVV